LEANDDENDGKLESSSPGKKSSIWKSTLPLKLYPAFRKNSSGTFKAIREMPNFKKRNSFSPLKERERRFIESNKSSCSLHMFNSISYNSVTVNLNGSPSSHRSNWKELSYKEKIKSSNVLGDELLINGLKSTSLITDSEKVSPKNQNSPGKKSIFGLSGLKKNSQDMTESQKKKNSENKNDEDLEVNSVYNGGQIKDSDDDSILTREENKSNHSDGEVRLSNMGKDSFLFEMINSDR